MKKLAKGFLGLVLSIMLVGTGFTSVSAYDSSITIERSKIVLGYLDDDLDVDYVSVLGNLKSNDAVVSNQEIAVDYDTYKAITKLNDEYEPALQELFNQYTKKSEELATKSNELAGLQEGTEEYNTALAQYNAIKAEVDTLEQQYTDKDAEYDAKSEKLVPGFDDSKWQKLNLKESTDKENRYSAKSSENYPYYVTWVKVSVNGKDYYNYSINCITEEPELPKCKIVEGKYYDNDGKEITKAEYDKKCGNPKTGNNMYYTYGAVIVIAACGLYMATRKVKKLSK